MKKIEVDKIASDAAHSAFRMDDPDPRGYISGTNAARVRRALWAYEWGKKNKRDAGDGYAYLFTDREVADAVLAMERESE